MSSEPHDTGTSARPLLVSVVAAAGVLLLGSVLTTGRGGIWRLADYPFKVEQFWPEALKVGRALQELPRTNAPRWGLIGSSIVQYGTIAELVEAQLAPAQGPRPAVTKLAMPQIIFSDAVILTQVAQRQAPLALVLIGIHPRDFDTGLDPHTTLAARIFDDAGVRFDLIEGRSPARWFERAVARVWPAFRFRRLQHRVFHALLPTGKTASTAIERTTPIVPAYLERRPAGRYDTTDGNTQLAELRPWIRWCRARQIHPVLVYFPEKPQADDAVWPRELGDMWAQTLETTLREEGGTFINARDVIPPEGFFDFNHLHQDGTIQFSTWLGERLQAELVALPAD